MARITANNSEQFRTSTLLIAFDEIERHETDDTEELIGLLGVQSAITRTLEDRGFTYDEQDRDWSCPVVKE
jgi:hypothetical protein